MMNDEFEDVDVTFRPGYIGRDGSTGEICVLPAASRYENGELRFHFTLTNGERLVFPTDFPVLVQVLAWSVLSIASDTGSLEGEKFSSVCRLIEKIEALFKLP